MIPSALAGQLQQGLADFLRFSFWSSTPGMERVIEDLLAVPGGLSKGPYLSVKLPFSAGRNPRYFPDVPLGFTPHAHQERAFLRLGGMRKRSTLIATGTGSGKTESFLVPILDHCLREAGTPGIKAILIYPMNALATDQAGRIARLVAENPKLAGRVTAGLYIGETKGKRRLGEAQMGADHVITDRDAMQDDPPDILLTNYKMLDYLLLRPEDQGIWRNNLRGTLRFLVVDELHTFDGAQGTDLACLIRRLKRRLQVDDGSLCCVGTSATLGGEDAADELLHYAGQVFGETFDDESVVGESRLSAAQFLAGAELQHVDEPGPKDLATLAPSSAATTDAWLAEQARLWVGAIPGEVGSTEWSVALGQRLKRHAVFRTLVSELDRGVLSLDDAVERLAAARSAWRRDPALGRAALTSLLGLVSVARSWRAELPEVREAREAAGRPRPVERFLDVRLQLWQRELRRMVATVGPRPALAFSDDLDRETRRRHLPLVHCRDCGAMGWATKIELSKRHVLHCDLKAFYSAFFADNPRVRFLFPRAAVADDDPAWRPLKVHRVDPNTLVALGKDEDEPPGGVVELVESDNLRSKESKQVLHRDCPFCGSAGSLSILGFQAATLTSVYIDQLFASRFNDDKKLLTFSDSVQDAAHRAGFFGARTWRTNLRVAIQRVLAEAGEDVALSELPARFSTLWRDWLDEASWVATFLAPNMQWLHDWDALRKDGRLPTESDLPRLIERRIAWEIASEYGLQAPIGRSLPRTRSSTVYVVPERLERAVRALIEPLMNEVPGLRDLTADEVRRFVLGLVHRLRLRGGIHHAELPAAWLESGGKQPYLISRNVHLPDVGRRSRLPVFLANHRTAQFETWFGGSSPGWYERWVTRCLVGDRALGADAASTYPVVLPRLVSAGLLRRVEMAGGGALWGVSDAALQVTTGVVGLVCSGCGRRVPVAAGEAALWERLPCLTAACDGHYVRDAEAPPDYFGRLYATGDLERIFTAEHTGLLGRTERERVEREFKALEAPPGEVEAAEDPGEIGEIGASRWRRPWFPNLLSCTPTLEMGIDIGDLSSAILCSVPPAQANYLQRVGRAGRRDGNSLVLTVANARPHDQYFYAQPEEMMEGEVTPPGVFLDAAAVLERQLTAFCFDRWVAELGDAAVLPRSLQQVFSHLDDDGSATRAGRFPHSLLRFIEGRQTELLREFREMFGGAVSEGTHEHLRRFLRGTADGGEGLRWRILNAFTLERKQRDSLRGQAKKLTKEIKRLEGLEAKPKDIAETLAALESEKEAVQELAKAISQRGTLEFLTDLGLLPNYAFPESAVRLTSVIWRRKKQVADDAAKKYDVWSFEYQRAPVSALSELAPNAAFYAGGRRVQVDRVDLVVSQPEEWRFCDACSHAQRETAEVLPVCPACGSTSWKDDGQRLRLLPLRQVFASTPDRESRIRDERDTRQPAYFEREMLMDFRKEDRVGAWAVQDKAVPFGFEYLKRATFREVNFGESTDDGERTRIAGKEAIRPGFEVCRHCGKVKQPRKALKHALTCPTETQGAAEQLESCLYLYREFASEALRMLLLMSDVSATRQLHSFVAALQVGLRAKFRGSVDHLKTMVYSEPDEEGTLRRQYLVLYDTVPGGTGYLKQLVTGEEEGAEPPLLEVLGLARRKLMACSCWNDAERDGCYRCLLGYRNSREMDDTSARTAVDLITQILDHREALESIESIGKISLNGLLDSVLEARFLEALRQVKVGGEAGTLTPAIVASKAGYRLELSGQEWTVEPQLDIPKERWGVEVSIDFVMRPRAGSKRKPLAVFLDGWQFHKKRIGWDLLQRQLLQASGEFDVWTFTWADLDEVLLPDKAGEAVANVVHPDLSRLRAMLQKMGLVALKEVAERPIFEVFAGDLASEAGLPWAELGRGILASRMGPATSGTAAAWAARVKALAPTAAASTLVVPAPQMELVDDGELSPWVRTAAVFANGAVSVVSQLDDADVEADGFKAAWNGFWRWFQLTRGVGGWLTTTSERESAAWQHVVALRSGVSVGWELEELLDAFRPLCAELAAAGAERPEVGLDVPSARGDVWGEGELVWESEKVAVTDRKRAEDARGEVAAGWRVLVLEELGEAPHEAVLAALREAGGEG